MNPEVFKKLHPLEFYKAWMENSLRPDGRNFDEYRKTWIKRGTLSTCEGSAMIRLGKTMVVCGIRMYVAAPRMNAGKEGYFVPHIILSPTSAKRSKFGMISEEEKVLNDQLYRLVQESKMLDMADLCIQENEAVWTVQAEIVCLNFDGNVFDACVIALVSGLQDVQFPKVCYSEETGSVSIIENEIGFQEKLKIKTILYPATFGFFDDRYLLVDPNSEEQGLIRDGTLHIVYNASEQLVLVWKRGGSGINLEIMEICFQKALARIEELKSLLSLPSESNQTYMDP